MTIWIAWVVFPLVVGALSLGCGLLVERAAGIELPSPLLLPLGFAVVIVGAQFAIIGGGRYRLQRRSSWRSPSSASGCRFPGIAA